MTDRDKYEMIIDGRPIATDRAVEVPNPAAGSAVATVAQANPVTVDEAVASARQGSPA